MTTQTYTPMPGFFTAALGERDPEVFGAIGKVETVWAWGDLMNGLQIFPNLVGLIGLSGVAAAALREGTRKA